MTQWSTPQGEFIEFDLSPIELSPHWFAPRKKRVFRYVGARVHHSGFLQAAWQANCVICSEPFEITFNVGARTSGCLQIVTCRAHRGALGAYGQHAMRTVKAGKTLSPKTIAGRQARFRKRVRDKLAERTKPSTA